MSNTLLLPVCGQSVRFNRMALAKRPKYLYTHPSGDLMLGAAIRGLPLDKFERIIVGALVGHDAQFGVVEALKAQFAALGREDVAVVLLNPTPNQPATVRKMIEIADVRGAVLVKDCDNYFSIEEPSKEGAVYVARLEDHPHMRAGELSYVVLDEFGQVRNITEKRVISPTFCAGGYNFPDAFTLNLAIKQHPFSQDPQFYLSHVIYDLLVGGVAFEGQMVTGYEDWGTAEAWERYCNAWGTLFVDMDGVICENGSAYFCPRWGDVEEQPRSVKALAQLCKDDKVKIVVTTSRPEELRETTMAQLCGWGIHPHALVMGLPASAPRLLVDDAPAFVNKARAYNVARDADELAMVIHKEWGVVIP